MQSFPKARKFQIKPFPLFDSLGELYDGQTADGMLNFTFVEPTQTKPSVTQVNDDEAQEIENGTSPNLHDDDDDNEVMILHQLDQGCAATSTMPTTSSSRRPNPRDKEPAAPRDKVGKVGQKCKRNADVADMMGEYLALKTKQAEEEAAEQERARTKADADDFPITMCIAVVDQMEELSDDEKVDSFDIFKDAQNRAIFMTAKPSTGLLWLRKKIMNGPSRTT